jgi:hypothetical protein
LIFCNSNQNHSEIVGRGTENTDTIYCASQFQIDSNIFLCFDEYRQISCWDSIASVPVIIDNGIRYNIIGLESFDRVEFIEDSELNFLPISPHKKYFYLERTEFLPIFEGKDTCHLFVRFSLVFINVLEHRVVYDIFEHYNFDGFWSDNDEWIRKSDSSVVFDSSDEYIRQND